MPDFGPLVAFLAFSYGATMIGLASGLGLRAWFCRNRRLLLSHEAALCALMPLVALAVSFVASQVQTDDRIPFVSLHQVWHTWAGSVLALPNAHITLHVVHAVIVIGAFFFVSRTVMLFAQMQAMVKRLRSTPGRRIETAGELPVVSLRESRPLCFTIGMFQPRVYVSTGLLEQLSPRHRDAMLSHEAAHIRRRDGLMSALLLALYRLAPLPGSSLLYREWQRAAERACDAYAARALGNPCDVASALVEVTRLAGRQTLPGAAFFGSPEDVEGRVHSLLNLSSVDPNSRDYGRLLLCTALNGMLFASVATWMRHFAEILVSH